MDVSGVGHSPAGFSSAPPETALDPQRSSLVGAVREKLGQARQASLDLLSDERLGRELVSLGLRPDPGKILAARGLVLQQGRIDPALLAEVERSLQAFEAPGPSEAEAAAFLLARRLPASPETMSWVLGRQHAADSGGSRMIAIIQRFVAAMLARTAGQGTPAGIESPHRGAGTSSTGAGQATEAGPGTGATRSGAGASAGDLLAKLQGLSLPEGDAREVAEGLKRLVGAMQPQEAELARGEAAGAKERLSAMAARVLAEAPQDASAREVHDEVRFQQVRNARQDGQDPHEIVIPVWWNAGSGEIRVQEHPKGALRRSDDDSAPVRVVLSLETPHLGALRIDLLLAQRQVNCLVAVQDQGAADFVSARLTELRSAIEETGIVVHAMGMKPFKSGDGTPGPGDAKGVDYYG